MNGYSEASIVCGGNIGDPGFYLYLAKVKQKLQKILKTDREDLLIEKVERWNSVRVTFRLPPSSAEILRSLAEHRAETLRNLGIQSVQVGTGGLVSLLAATAVSIGGSLAGAITQSSSTADVNWSHPNANGSNSAIAAPGEDAAPGSSALAFEHNSSTACDDKFDIGQSHIEQKGSITGQNEQANRLVVAKGIMHSQHPSALSIQQHDQQQNLLGYLLDEPDQAPPPPPPYQGYQQHMSIAASSGSAHVLQQQQRYQQLPPQNTAVMAWNNHLPPTTSSTITASGRTVSDYYYQGHQPHHVNQQLSPQSLVPSGHQHRQHTSATSGASVMHSQQQHETVVTMVYSSGTNTSTPAYHHNINFGHQQPFQNPGNVSNSPLLVGLLQQNSPPPSQPPSSSSSFMQLSTASSVRQNAGNLCGYNNEHVTDSSLSSWPPVFSTQGPTEPIAKKQKRASATTKPKKTPSTSSAKSSTGKKNAPKRAGAVTTSDAISVDGSVSASSYLVAVDPNLPSQEREHLHATSATSSFNRDTSINSVIDSVLCNVTMAAGITDSSLTNTSDTVMESKARRSLESPAVQAKLTSSNAGLPTGPLDETSSQCSGSPASMVSFPGSAKHQQTSTMESPTHHPPHQRQQSVLRSISSSSSSSSPLVASASIGGDGYNLPAPPPGGSMICANAAGIPTYGPYQNKPNHQFIRHHPYQQHQETDVGVTGLRRLPVPHQPGSRLAHPSAVARFPATPGAMTAPGHAYPPHATYDLAHHDNASQFDGNSYSSPVMQTNIGKSRSPAAATVNGDIYSSQATAAMTPYPLYRGAQVAQQEQYGAVGSWPTRGGSGEHGGNNANASAETGTFMISSKTTATVASSAFGMPSGGADHDYLVGTSVESASGASSFSTCVSDQQQPPVVNDFYGFTSSGPRQQGVYSYGPIVTRIDGGPACPAFYNGGGDGQQMQEALVAQHVHQQPQASTPAWDKQPQRVTRHRQSWALPPSQQSYEPHGGGATNVYDADSVMRDAAGTMRSSPLDGFPTASQQHQSSLISAASSQQQQQHTHGVTIPQQLQAAPVDDPMLSGQVPAR